MSWNSEVAVYRRSRGICCIWKTSVRRLIGLITVEMLTGANLRKPGHKRMSTYNIL